MSNILMGKYGDILPDTIYIVSPKHKGKYEG